MEQRTKELLQFAVFVIIFCTVLLGLNMYVISRIFIITHQTYASLPIALVLALSVPSTYILEKSWRGNISRVLFTISSVWLGSAFLLLWPLLLYDFLRLTIGAPQWFGIVALVIGAVLIIYAILNSTRIVSKTIQIRYPKKNVRVVQLSDIHIGTIRNGPYLERIVKKVNKLQPDIVVITGDLVDGSAPLHYDMLLPFNKIKAPIFMVHGNHEQYEGIPQIEELLKQTPIRILNDESVDVHGVQLIGIKYNDDYSYAAKTLNKFKITKNKPTILLYHVPESTDAAAKAGVTLQLAGHTHNGQIYPMTLLVRIVHKHICGLYKIGTMSLYVSPGTGTWGPPMRLGSCNEVTLHIIGEQD